MTFVRSTMLRIGLTGEVKCNVGAAEPNLALQGLVRAEFTGMLGELFVVVARAVDAMLKLL